MQLTWRKEYEKERAGKTIVVYVASYTSLDGANADYAAVKQLNRDGIIELYDAAVVSKDAAGHVKIHAKEMPMLSDRWQRLALRESRRQTQSRLDPGVRSHLDPFERSRAQLLGSLAPSQPM